MILLGVDPSYRNFCLVLAEYKAAKIRIIESDLIDGREAGSRFNVSKSQSQEDILGSRAISQAFQKYSLMADWILAESPTGSQSAKAAKYAGVCMTVLGAFAKPIVLMTPQEIKKGFTGSAKATKREMIDKAYQENPEAPWRLNRSGRLLNANEHTADAIGAIHVGLRRALEGQGAGVYYPDTEWELGRAA